MNYQTPRSQRRESRTLVGKFRGGKLAPVMAVAIRPSEGGTLSQDITLELDPIAGRMITPIVGEAVAVFVPIQAIDYIKDPDAAYAGMTEVLREKLLSGNPLFGLEAEGEISKRCGVNPRSVGGVKQVSEIVRLAHNAAINFLRQRKYENATLLPHTSTAITPALIAQTVLDRMNGVLDPDDRINGSVALEMPSMQIPLRGFSVNTVSSNTSVNDKPINDDGTVGAAQTGTSHDLTIMRTSGTQSNPLFSPIYADSTGAPLGNVSLVDFYNAEKMDALTRKMRQIVDENPEYGQEMVLRWAHGLSVDTGKTPFVMAEKSQIFGRNIVGATDAAGIAADAMRSDMMLKMAFTVPVPRTELGGVIVTFATLKPDETLQSQPHPFLSEPWGIDNFVADELALDPVPVTVRELDSDCATLDENIVSMYVGHNALKQTYVHYGLNRHVNPETVENKTALWQLKIPLSVTPETILYPADLDHYPFAFGADEVCTYTIMSQAVIQTPTIFGPTPVEQLAVIGGENLFEQE